MEQCRRQINMCRDRILHVALRNTRTTNEQGHPNILFEPTGLARRQTVLTNMETIIRSINDVRIIHLTALLQTRHQRLHQLINALQSAQTRAVEMIVILDY